MWNQTQSTKMTGVLALTIGVLLLCTALPMLSQDGCFLPPPLGAIIPLYMYPFPADLAMGRPVHAWQPLLDARSKYPNLEIWAILSPSTGEAHCKNKLPGCKCSDFDADYVAGAKLLKTHGIRMLGYVATGHKNVNESSLRPCMYENIDTWQKHVDDYAAATPGPDDEPIIEAIFFDEMDTVKDQAIPSALARIDPPLLGKSDPPSRRVVVELSLQYGGPRGWTPLW